MFNNSGLAARGHADGGLIKVIHALPLIGPQTQEEAGINFQAVTVSPIGELDREIRLAAAKLNIAGMRYQGIAPDLHPGNGFGVASRFHNCEVEHATCHCQDTGGRTGDGGSLAETGLFARIGSVQKMEGATGREFSAWLWQGKILPDPRTRDGRWGLSETHLLEALDAPPARFKNDHGHRISSHD